MVSTHAVPSSAQRWSRSAIGLDYGAIVLCILALVVHLTLVWPYVSSYFFLFDDFGLVYTASLTDLAGIFTQPLFNFFRPLLFVLTRAEFSYFGWHNPAGYASLALVLHLVNAMLVGLLARQLGLHVSSAALAATLFAFSPWSTESYLWQSSQFDLLATLGSLTYFAFGLRTTGEHGSIWHAVFALMALAFALAGKEHAVVAPAILLALVVGRQMRSSGRTAQLVLWIGSSLLCLSYLIVRQRLLPGLSGAYGSFFQLMSSANILDNFLTYCRALVIWVMPESESLTSYAWFVAAVFPMVGAVVPGLLINGIRGNLKLALRFGVCFALSLMPVLWVGIAWMTSASGRFLYLPAIWFVLLLAVGFDTFQTRVRSAPTLVRVAVPGVVIAILLGAALASVAHQVAIWSAACDLARQAVGQVRQAAAQGGLTKIHIRNLPYMFVEGPYVLKTYAFRLYDGGLGNVKVRADVAPIRWRDGRMCALDAGTDRDSDYIADPNDTDEYSLTLVLPIEPSCEEAP